MSSIFSHIFTHLRKNYREVGEMSATRFQVPRMPQPQIYFWRRATTLAGRFNPFSRLVWDGEGSILFGLVFRVGGPN